MKPRRVKQPRRDTTPGVDDIIRYEQGNMDREETRDLFQRLVSSGLVWNLQGSYGREADRMIREGLIDA